MVNNFFLTLFQVKISSGRSDSLLSDRHSQLSDHHKNLEIKQIQEKICGQFLLPQAIFSTFQFSIYIQ
jgi:hypothetical protein